MTNIFPMPGCRVEQVTPETSDVLSITAHGTGPGSQCPDCGRASRAVHSRYRRKPADLPSLGRRVRVSLRVRRFYCRNAKCVRRTFAEQLPELVAPHARRTCRLAAAQARVGVALGGNAGSRLLCHLAMPASTDTVLRLVHRLPLPAQESPRVVGVDDWALRKRCTYGTVMVDLERRRVLDLLPNRTAETLAEWLREHPAIEAVARDRSTEYVRGISLGAPKAEQVADRWHLLANMRQAVERWLHAAQARLRRLPMPPSDGGPTVSARRGQAFRRSAPERAAGAETRARWQARHAEVRQRHLAGEALLGIARATGLALGTVRKYARAEVFPARTPHGPGPSILDPYLAHLERRLAEGCENGMALWRELRGQGFPGGTRQVHRWLIERRTAPAKTGPHVRRTREADEAGPPTEYGTAPALPTVPQLAWLLVQPATSLDATDAAIAARVEQDEQAVAVVGLARRFTALLRACGVAGRRDGRAPADPTVELDAWLADARTCSAPAIATFAAGLEVDGAAVRAAVTQPWSSGQADLDNRIRQQLWRYYPQLLELADDGAAEWILALWTVAPTPAKAARMRETTLARLLKQHRVCRIDAQAALGILRQPAINVAAGVTEAAVLHLRFLVARLRLANRELQKAEQELEQICAELTKPEGAADDSEPTDAALLLSLPGVACAMLQTRLPFDPDHSKPMAA